MRLTKLAVFMAVFLIMMSALSMAARNKFGVADVQQVTFTEPTQVGDVVLPKGEYKVQHTMEGENHIMIFTQSRKQQPATARVKCQLEPLPEKASQNMVLYRHGDKDVHVLQQLVFRGDTARHVF